MCAFPPFSHVCFTETAADSEQRPRPHSALIRQSSWSGLSESSSHESLSGSLVKSSSLSSMRTPSDSKASRSASSHTSSSSHDALLSVSEVKGGSKSVLRNTGTNGCGDAVSRKPPLGRRDASTPPPPSSGAVLVQRSQVCLSSFYKECAESADPELDCSCQPAEGAGRSVSPPAAHRWWRLIGCFSPVCTCDPQTCGGAGRQEQGRGRELQQRFLPEPRAGRKAAAAPHANQTPSVGAASRQRGRPAAGRTRSRRRSRRDRAESVGPEAVQKRSSG